MTVTMHPQVIGRGHRMLFLEQFIDYVAGHANARFTRLADYPLSPRVARLMPDGKLTAKATEVAARRREN